MKLSFEDDYAYHLFMYGDVFNNVLNTFIQYHGQPQFTIPRKYKEVVEITKFFYLRWEKHLT